MDADEKIPSYVRPTLTRWQRVRLWVAYAIVAAIEKRGLVWDPIKLARADGVIPSSSGYAWWPGITAEERAHIDAVTSDVVQKLIARHDEEKRKIRESYERQLARMERKRSSANGART